MSVLELGPLSLRVSGYAGSPSGDFYEANWLRVHVSCATGAGEVAFEAPCLMTTDIFDFMDEMNDLRAGQGRQAYLVSLETQIDVRLSKGGAVDEFLLEIELTPNVDDDEDIYDLSETVSRAAMEDMAAQAAKIVEAFPVRGIPKP